MFIGVSTDNFASRPTPLSKDITDLLQFNVKAIEIVPKSPADLRESGALKVSLGKYDYIAVQLPPLPVTTQKTSMNAISKYYQEGFQFAAELGAQLVMIRPDFPGCGSPKDTIKFLQPLLEQATKKGLNVAPLNNFSPESQYSTFEQVTEV